MAVEKGLGIQFTPHESTFLGGNYYRWQSENDAELLILRENIDVLYQVGIDAPEERWAEPQFRHMPVLLYVEQHDQPDMLRQALLSRVQGIAHLSREE